MWPHPEAQEIARATDIGPEGVYVQKDARVAASKRWRSCREQAPLTYKFHQVPALTMGAAEIGDIARHDSFATRICSVGRSHKVRS